MRNSSGRGRPISFAPGLPFARYKSMSLSFDDLTYHILDDIGEETATILSDCVVSNDSLDCVCSFLSVLRVELLTEFPILP